MSAADTLARPSFCVLAAEVDALAIRALTRELECYPKPGLVSLADSGSHSDMDASTFRASIAALKGYFGEMAKAGADGGGFADLNALGRRAEARMFAATGGVNTHRGAVFSLGLAAAAAGARHGAPSSAAGLCRTVAELWGDDIRAAGARARQPSHGAQVQGRYGATGARDEAAAGFPTVVGHALPAYRSAVRAGADEESAMVQAFFAIVASLEDNNLLYRGGPAALERAKRLAFDFLGRGGVLAPDWADRAIEVHRDFVARRMSPGGAADLLAVAVFVDSLDPARPARCR